MLDCMSSRGPDSAGIAVYREPDGQSRISLRTDTGIDWDEVAGRMAAELRCAVAVEKFGNTATVVTPAPVEDALRVLAETSADVVIVGFGQTMEIVKDVGAPREISWSWPQECPGSSPASTSRRA